MRVRALACLGDGAADPWPESLPGSSSGGHAANPNAEEPFLVRCSERLSVRLCMCMCMCLCLCSLPVFSCVCVPVCRVCLCDVPRGGARVCRLRPLLPARRRTGARGTPLRSSGARCTPPCAGGRTTHSVRRGNGVIVSRATSGAALRCSSLAARLARTTSLMSWCWTRTRCRPCSCARHRHRRVCARVCTRGSGCVFLCLCVGWVGCVWVRLCARVCLCLCVFFVREFRGGDDLSDPAGACSFCCVGGCTRWSTRTCSRT